MSDQKQRLEKDAEFALAVLYQLAYLHECEYELKITKDSEVIVHSVVSGFVTPIPPKQDKS